MRTPLASAALVASTLAACGGGHSSAAPTPTQPDASAPLTPVADSAEWPSATPDAEGFDTTHLTDLVRRIRGGTYGPITSMLIVRNGRLVVEEHFSATSNFPVTMQSVSKSVTSLLTGIAVDQGRLGVRDQVIARFHQYDPIAHLDARKAALTVEDLLTMRTGFDWDENPYAGSPLQALNTCRCDWLRFMLDWPMAESPGTRWEYVSGGVILLGGFIGQATGQRLDQFALQYLFGPLDAQSPYWTSGLPDGLPHAGGGLFLRPRDMAKIGQLVLDDGRWHDRQVVSSAWIRESTAMKVPGVGAFGSHGVDYGYLWWRVNPSDVIAAVGARGQFIFVSRADRVVVTVTSDNTGATWSSPVDFFYSDILTSIR